MDTAVAPSHSLQAASPAIPSIAVASSSSKDDVIGISITCDDCTEQGDTRRNFRFYRNRHRAVDLVRATIRPQEDIQAADGTLIARVAFSSPVMSRRHAQIYFSDDGLVTLTDVGSLHGTFVTPAGSSDTVQQVPLEPNKPYALHTGDVVYLGKAVPRENKTWKPLVMQVKILTARNCMTPYVMNNITAKSKASSGQISYGINLDDDEQEEENDDDDSLDSSSSNCDTSSPDSSPPSETKPLDSAEGRPAEGQPDSSQPTILDVLPETRSLRSILPLPFQRIQSLQSSLTLPPLYTLPSLRELGFFGGSSKLPEPVNNEAQVTPTSHCQQSTAQSPIDPCPSNVVADSLGGSSILSQVEAPLPSYPENQLGLLNLQAFDSSSRTSSCEEITGVTEVPDREQEESPEIEEIVPKKEVIIVSSESPVQEEASQWGSPMEMSPSSSRSPSPAQSAPFKVPESRRSANEAAEDMRRRAERELKAANSWTSHQSLQRYTQPAATSRHAMRSYWKKDPYAMVQAQINRSCQKGMLHSSFSNDVQRELAGMREEIRHLSSLVHNSFHNIRSERERSSITLPSQVHDSRDREGSPRVLLEESESISPSLKRKRSDDETEDVGPDVSESVQTTDDSSGRPSKRLRHLLSTGDIVRGVATAAGYTSLGAVITWAALAYV